MSTCSLARLFLLFLVPGIVMAACPGNQVVGPGGGCVDPDDLKADSTKWNATAKAAKGGNFNSDKSKQDVLNELASLTGYNSGQIQQTVNDSLVPGKRGLTKSQYMQVCLQNCSSCETIESQCALGAANLPDN